MYPKLVITLIVNNSMNLSLWGKKKEQSLYQSKPSPLYYKYYWLHNYITVFIVTAGKATKQLSCSRYSTDI